MYFLVFSFYIPFFFSNFAEILRVFAVEIEIL